MLVYCIFLLTVIVKVLNMINPNMEKKEELTCWFLVLFTCRLAVIVKVFKHDHKSEPSHFQRIRSYFL